MEFSKGFSEQFLAFVSKTYLIKFFVKWLRLKMKGLEEK